MPSWNLNGQACYPWYPFKFYIQSSMVYSGHYIIQIFDINIDAQSNKDIILHDIYLVDYILKIKAHNINTVL